MCGQDRLEHIVEERRIRRGQADAHRAVVDLCDLAHILEIRLVVRLDVGIQHRLDGEFDIRRTQRLSIVPEHPVAQVEHIGIGLGIILVRFRQPRHDRARSIAPHHPVKEQENPPAVLILQRIELIVFGRTADNTGALHSIVASLLRPTAARTDQKGGEHT